MSRLINADKLKSLFSPALTGKTTYTADEIMLSIVSSPTVEAIPIEWIKNKKVDFQNESKSYNYLRGMQDGYNDCIDYLLSEWELENGIDR